jgi:hypothetical protein
VSPASTAAVVLVVMDYPTNEVSGQAMKEVKVQA